MNYFPVTIHMSLCNSIWRGTSTWKPQQLPLRSNSCPCHFGETDRRRASMRWPPHVLRFLLSLSTWKWGERFLKGYGLRKSDPISFFPLPGLQCPMARRRECAWPSEKCKIGKLLLGNCAHLIGEMHGSHGNSCPHGEWAHEIVEMPSAQAESTLSIRAKKGWGRRTTLMDF